MTEKQIEAEIRKIATAIFDIDSFPPENVIAFLNASTKAMSIVPISPFFVTMIAKSGLAFNPYIAGVATVRTDLSGGSSDVVTYNSFQYMDTFWIKKPKECRLSTFLIKTIWLNKEILTMSTRDELHFYFYENINLLQYIIFFVYK